MYLCDDEEVLVTAYHINYVVGKFEHDGRLAADNRTGFDGLLHSVGVLRDKVLVSPFQVEWIDGVDRWIRSMD